MDDVGGGGVELKGGRDADMIDSVAVGGRNCNT